MLKRLLKWLASLLLVALGLLGAAFWWVQQPLDTRQATLDLSIEPGTSAQGIAQAVADAGAQTVDLEGLANHRGSAFGSIGQPDPPTFEHI